MRWEVLSLVETAMAMKKKPALSTAELEALAIETVDEPVARKIMTVYAEAKDLYVRNLCLRLLYDRPFGFLEDWFDRAFRRERYLDMRVLALRGLAQFRGEKPLASLLAKINGSLHKRAISTPYNYQEYEGLLGKNALPYLVGRYGYACLQETLALVQRNYDAMPNALKGHFTIGEDGKPISLRSSEETNRMLNEFFAAANRT